jgi:two-component system chemotaxis sensor kinase CheA
MENIRQKFLDEALLKTENLSALLSNNNLDENLHREIFRTLHTLKGTSQTLGFRSVGKLAHELENLLQIVSAEKKSKNEEAFSLLKEGIAVLSKTVQFARTADEAEFSDEFIEKLRAFLPVSSVADADYFSDAILPPAVLNKLSIDEKKSLQQALADGKSFYSLEVEFSLFDFDKKFRELREKLSDKGEIIANFPKPDVSDPTKIGFRTYFTSPDGEKYFSETAKIFEADLTNLSPQKIFTDDLSGILEQTIFAGKKLAAQMNKTVEFEITNSVFDVASEYLRLFSEILLHLVRNAVDHAIERSGRIKIDVQSENDNLFLRFADDGRGLEREKILAKAVEKNLADKNANLTTEEIFDFIFAHGFSTAAEVSEISGRGVGLDVVRDAVEKAGGKISVKSGSSEGTIFEVVLPNKL